MRGKSLPLAAIPLQVRWHESDDELGELSEIHTPGNLQTDCAPFRLPDDWIVEEKPRPSSIGNRRHVDRMLAETQIRGGTLSVGLPDNWIVEEKPRNYGVMDRTYIEPETGRRFRSLLAAQRYLGEDNGFVATAKPLSKHGSEKQRASGENCCAEAVGKPSNVAEEDEICVKY